MKTKADLSQSIAEVQTALREIATLARNAGLKAEEVNDVILG